MKRTTARYTDDEQELVAGFIANHHRCLEQIYAENYLTVERYILQNSGERPDAKDIYQEAIVAAWINARDGKFEIKDGKTIGGYIFQIAKYKWLDRLKSKAYRSTIRLVHDNRSDSEGLPEYDDEQESRMQYLKTLYASLNEKCKAILGRFYYEKKSLEEIGLELGYDPGTVKTLKYRCMKKLKSVHQNNTPT